MHEHVELQILPLGEPRATLITGELNGSLGGLVGQCWLRDKFSIFQRVETFVHGLLDVIFQILYQLRPRLLPAVSLPSPGLALYPAPGHNPGDLGEGVGHLPPVDVVLLPVYLQHLLVLARSHRSRAPGPPGSLVSGADLEVFLVPGPARDLLLTEITVEGLVVLPHVGVVLPLLHEVHIAAT